MLGAGLCRLCSLCRWRAREGSERGGGKEVEGRGWGRGAARADPVEKTPQEEEEDTQQAARERY